MRGLPILFHLFAWWYSTSVSSSAAVGLQAWSPPAPSTSTSPPPNTTRSDTSYDWCDCGTGLVSIKVWTQPEKQSAAEGAVASVVIATNQSTYITFPAATKTIFWSCDHMNSPQASSLSQPAAVWSVKFYRGVKAGPFGLCGKPSGRVRWNTFSSVPYRESVPYTSYSEGYTCFKIPVLLRTTANTLLAFAEARQHNCSDFARTDLVVKRSTDGGESWSSLQKVGQPSEEELGQPGLGLGLCGNPLVIGNAAPVQLSNTSSFHPGRILVPHMRNNFETWLVHSDDDGITWSKAVSIPGAQHTSRAGPDCMRNMSYFGINSTASFLELIRELGWTTNATNPYHKWADKLVGPWQFNGIGPPASTQLRSGRILVPGYHAFIRGLTAGESGHGAGIGLPVSQLYNNFALGHVLLSDDGGDTWQLRAADGYGGAPGEGGNEAQIAQLPDGSVIVNSRALAIASTQLRVQARSFDGGETWSPTKFVQGLPEPFAGCQGSLIAAGRNSSTLYFSHPNPQPNHSIAPSILKLLGGNVNLTSRDHMTVWCSQDGGLSWTVHQLVDSGSAGYSALQPGAAGSLWLLYEQSDRLPDSFAHLEVEALIGSLAVLDPDRFVLRLLEVD